MEKKIKRIITLLLIVIAVCLILMVAFKMINKSNSTDYSKDSQGIEDFIQIEENNTIIYENNESIYYTVVSVVNKYINESSKDNKDKILNMLDLQYVADNKININNVTEITKISPLENDFHYYEYIPETMYSMDEGRITTHFIYGYYHNNADLNKIELNLMVELDSVNQTFNIYDYNYMLDKGYNNLKAGDTYNTKLEQIENRKDNVFTYINVSDEEMTTKYLENFKELVIFDKEKAFQILNDEYSNLKFKDKEDFNSFIENKKIEFFIAELEEYTVKMSNEGNKVYTCKDQNDNIYYFQETDGVMRYEAILDNYVLPDEEFKNKYNNTYTDVKVLLNIDRFIQAINDKNYYYAYNCLADSYKNNYFKTQEEFANYAAQNFYEKSNVEYKFFEAKKDVYTYAVTLTDEVTGEQMNKTFVVQLGEGTEFVLSFDK